ncbi:MAG: hypothetical protein LAT67_13065 [Balneolales bacterium]|nr:hypothetical protein [Balneolales bacterium]
MMSKSIKLSLAFISMFFIGLLSGYLIAGVYSAAEQTRAASEQVEATENRPQNDEAGSGNGPSYRSGGDQWSEERMELMRQRITEQLSLNPGQQEPLFELISETRMERRNLMQESRRAFRDEMQQHNQLFYERLAEILTDQQMQQWQELYSREAMQQRRGEQ